MELPQRRKIYKSREMMNQMFEEVKEMPINQQYFNKKL